MYAGRLLTTTLSVLALSWSGLSASAQQSKPWVDPPAEGASPGQASPQPAPSAPPVQASQPKLPTVSPTPEAKQAAEPRQPAPPAQQQAQPEPRTQAAEPRQKPPAPDTTRVDIARNFAVDYLATWSARNDVALDATAELYAPRVLFHGRTVSLERLYKEKQRFIRRWPEREYHPRSDAIGTQCNPAGTVCTVHAVFDYTAANPKRGRISQGSGALQLIVEFIGEKPLIVAEHSTLLSQTRKRTLAWEGRSNE